MSTRPERYYFAYGSNLAREQRSSWGLDRLMRPVAVGRLLDRKLAFTRKSVGWDGGVVDAVANQVGSTVPGVLFEVLDPAAWKELDNKEGARPGAGRKGAYATFKAPAWIETAHTPGTLEPGSLVDVTGYAVADPVPFVEPSAAYLDVVRRGYAEHGLDLRALEAAARLRRPYEAARGLAVYGTLMPGECASSKLLGFRRALPARIPGRLWDLGPYPMLSAPEREDHRVSGALVLVRDLAALLVATDEYEGGGYRRTLRHVELSSARWLAWVYEGLEVPSWASGISSGCWRTHQQAKSAPQSEA